MGLVSYLYKKNFVCRYDKEIGVPYYSSKDFKDLKQESYSFTNSKRINIKYFYYYYDNYKTDKVVLFCHGIGPGHTAYLAEIEALAKHGYKVLTLDYTGCGESEGKYLGSLNAPTRDVLELLDYLKLETPVVLVGHSLGGFTALNVINLRTDIVKAVIMSGFLSIESIIHHFVSSDFLVNRILKYESKIEPDFYKLDNLEYLKTTKDKLFFMQSTDDQMIPYDVSLKVVEEISNPCIEILKVENRKHNPNYTDSAVKYMNEVFGNYQYLLKEKQIKTDEERINYFKDVSLAKITEQDQMVIDKIVNFIEK